MGWNTSIPKQIHFERVSLLIASRFFGYPTGNGVNPVTRSISHMKFKWSDGAILRSDLLQPSCGWKPKRSKPFFGTWGTWQLDRFFWNPLHPWSLTARPSKKNGGWKTILSYWEGHFSRAMLNFDVFGKKHLAQNIWRPPAKKKHHRFHMFDQDLWNDITKKTNIF